MRLNLILLSCLVVTACADRAPVQESSDKFRLPNAPPLFFGLSPEQSAWRPFDDRQASDLRAIGVQLVRLQLCDWPNKRQELDAAVEAARRHGLEVMGEINYCTLYAPHDPVARQRLWHSGFTDAGNAFAGEFTRVAGEIARHFAGRIRYYEIWNEPNAAPRPFGFTSNPLSWPTPNNADWDGACGAYDYGVDYNQGAWALCPRQLGVLTVNASMAIRTADPWASVVAGNMLSHGDDGWVAREYWRQVERSPAVRWHLSNKGRPPWDYVAFHPYGYEGWSLQAQIGSFRALLDSFGDSSRIALSEYGWSTGPGEIHVTDDASQAGLLRSTMQVAADAGVAFVIWFNHYDSQGLSFGLRRQDGSYKPALNAYCEVAGAPLCPYEPAMSCGQLADREGWRTPLCENGFNNACNGLGVETGDCRRCCSSTVLSCGQLAERNGWQRPRCESNGNWACGGQGPATADCAHCCNS
jgi:hypothetical protein